MNRKEFLDTLEKCLKKLPADEKNDAMNYYRELFDDAGEDREQQIIEDLGAPEDIAEQILAENGIFSEIDPEYLPEKEKGNGHGHEESETQEPELGTEEKIKKDKNTLLAVIIILIVTSPIWGGIITGLLGAALGIFIAAFAIFIAFCAAGIALIAAGTAVIFSAPPFGLMILGIGLMLFGVSALIIKPVFKGLCKFAVWLVNKFVNFIKKILDRKESVQ